MTLDIPLAQFGVALAHRLLAASRSGEVEWSAGENGRIYADFETFKVAVDLTTASSPRLLLLDQRGRADVAFDAEELSLTGPATIDEAKCVLADLAELLPGPERLASEVEPLHPVKTVLGQRKPGGSPPPVIPRVAAEPRRRSRSKHAHGGGGLVPRVLSQGLCRHSWESSRSQPGTEVCHKCSLRRSALMHL